VRATQRIILAGPCGIVAVGVEVLALPFPEGLGVVAAFNARAAHHALQRTRAGLQQVALGNLMAHHLLCQGVKFVVIHVGFTEILSRVLIARRLIRSGDLWAGHASSFTQKGDVGDLPSKHIRIAYSGGQLSQGRRKLVHGGQVCDHGAHLRRVILPEQAGGLNLLFRGHGGHDALQRVRFVRLKDHATDEGLDGVRQRVAPGLRIERGMEAGIHHSRCVTQHRRCRRFLRHHSIVLHGRRVG